MCGASRSLVVLAVAGFAVVMPLPAWAGTPFDLQRRFEAEARATTPGFGSFSVQRGEAFFKGTHGSDWSCATCHTGNPLGPGKHSRTGKSIAPLAPSANPARFTDVAAVDKWFRRNCNDVLGRACTAQEKGDVLRYLMSLK
jgi:mono/diheme cytochrome c family protein